MSIEAKGPTPVVPAPAQHGGGSRFWTLDRAADALDQRAASKLPRGPGALGRVWTDTRSIQRGDLFVALVGEKFDAHDFLPEAVRAGAGAVVVSRLDKTRGLGVPVYQVDDTRVALGALGRYRRRAWNGPVVGIVGTNGKTSTKELIRATLESRLEVHATHLNLNNLIGVPQTLLEIPDHADVAVIEMGTNQPGEIATLRAIAEPNIVVVTSIAEEHLEGLGDLGGVMREEMAACDGVELAIVPANQPDVVAEATKRARHVLPAGLEQPPVEKWSLDAEGRGRLTVAGVEVTVPLRGVHNLRNATLALAVAERLGISMDDAARGIARVSLPPMRSAVERIGGEGGRALLINDAYNSNPGSARAALELLTIAGGPDSAGRQRVAVLGTMLELGPTTAALHDDIARLAVAAGLDLIVGVGEFGAALQRVGAPPDRVIAAPDAEAVWPKLASRLQPDAIILLKGSRGVRLERLVPLVTNWATTAS